MSTSGRKRPWKLEGMLEGRKIFFTMATFPKDGESSEALLGKVRELESMK